MKDSNPYYLSLGAGKNQLPLIKAAKDLGLRVIGIDQNLDAEGFSLCDLRIEESILNYRKIFYKVSTSLTDGSIRGGFCASYGHALYSWAFLTERLRLIGLNRTLVEVLIDKYLVRERLSGLEHHAFAQPLYLTLRSAIHKDDLEELGYPLIMKTRHGASKKNIYIAERYTEAKTFLTRRNLESLNIVPHEILLEEKIEGDEIIVCGFVQNFKFHFVSVHDKRTSLTAPYIDLEHTYPSKYEKDDSILTEIHQQIADRLHISDTPIVSEWKIKQGKYYLIEISPQIPGEFVPDFLIPQGVKYNYFQNLVRLTLGEPIEAVNNLKRQKARVQYWQEKIPQDEWKQKSQKASFAKVLNEKPKYPPESNADRFGVMGFTD